jgi:S-adenosylmethionine hydrolase
VDLTHGVPPFDVRAGALMLARSVGFLGPGVVVAVVDPEVGSGRRAVAVSVRGLDRPGADGPQFLVGPDNGLLGWAIDALGGASAAVALPAAVAPPAAVALPAAVPRTGHAGRTFDGRDLFAPVAARLWSGATLHDVGLPIDPHSLVRLRPPRLTVSPAGPGPTGRPGSVEAEVLWVDRFGNVQLAGRSADAARAGLDGPGRAVEITVHGGPPAIVRPGRTVASFSELGLAADTAPVADPEVGLMIDANGHLALVCHRRSAATVLGVRSGDMVTVSQVR